MTDLKVLQKIETTGVVAILRKVPEAKVERVVEALIKGGIKALEITLAGRDAFQSIEFIANKYSEIIAVGAGTVLDAVAARQAIACGADFLVSPNLKADVISTALRYGKVVIPGALTPTEIVQAIEFGAQAVKVFPAISLGPEYIKQVLAPLTNIRLIPTGGVGPENATAFIEAGAYALGVGGSLINKEAIRDDKYDLLTKTAKNLLEAVQKGRQKI